MQNQLVPSLIPSLSVFKLFPFEALHDCSKEDDGVRAKTLRPLWTLWIRQEHPYQETHGGVQRVLWILSQS